ncbi:TPA_asm: hypothetical protein vir530_00006 [dsDNA virus vir530]|nr:TPA_asm: hypothetical protein vir530_00006 [dsDNA virus vir530]
MKSDGKEPIKKRTAFDDEIDRRKKELQEYKGER